LSQGWLFMSVR